MANTRYIIPAAGLQSRWNNHTGTAKHMALIQGEPLIHRTIRMLQESGENNILVISRDKAFGRDGVQVVEPTWETILGNTGIGISAHLWSQFERTTVLFGDVVFSKEAIATIVTPRTEMDDDVWWFGRSGTGLHDFRWQELFGLTFLPHSQNRLLAAIKRVKNRRDALGNPNAGGWFVYRIMQGIQMDKHQMGEHWVEIDDETTDFDFPEDYDAWIQKFDKPTK